MTTENDQVNERRAKQMISDMRYSIFSLDAIVDSARTLLASLHDGSNISPGYIEVDLNTLAAIDPFGLFMLSNAYVFQQYSDRTFDRTALDEVGKIVEYCKSHGSRIILVINPMHADMMEMLDLLGYWQALEDWKVDIVEMAEACSSRGSGNVDVWDFTGYDTYATESVSADTAGLQWYWESFHYKKALGDLIIDRILGGGDERFGVKLSSDNVYSHLEAIREGRRRYRERQQNDVRRVVRLCEWMVRSESLKNVQCR